MLEDTDVVEQSGWKVGAFVDALCSKTGAWFLGIRRGVYFKEMLFKELGGGEGKIGHQKTSFLSFSHLLPNNLIFFPTQLIKPLKSYLTSVEKKKN